MLSLDPTNSVWEHGASRSAMYVDDGIAAHQVGEGYAALQPCVQEFTDAELAHLEVEERSRMSALGMHLAALRATWRRHATKRRRVARELLRRRFASSQFGRVLSDMLLPFLPAGDVLRWLAASPAVVAQHFGAERSLVVHHLRGVSPSLTLCTASGVAARMHWPAVRSIKIDLECPGWAALTAALADRRSVELSELCSLAITFSAERSTAWMQRWREVAPSLLQLSSHLAASAPLQELVLTDLRSADILTSILRSCSRQLRVCRASLIGPESRRQPLELPSTGLPVLECFMIRHRDFCEQRASRQERLTVFAAPLLACLNSVRRPAGLRVLVLAGIRVDGTREETARLLRGLRSFSGLSAVALRFSVPATFGSLLPLGALLALRRAWPKVGLFALGDMSVHGFDYWPEQMTDFRELYPHGQMPEPSEVFLNEFRHVLATQYQKSATTEWERMEDAEQSFWGAVACTLPAMPHSEVRRRVAELFPSGL